MYSKTPKVQPDLQKFVIISAAVTGIGLFWWQTTSKCYETVVSIVKNQLFVDLEKNKKIREQIENTCSLFEQLIEDYQKIKKAVQDGGAVQELAKKIKEKKGNITFKLKKLLEDIEGVQLESETENKLRRIKYYISESIKIYKELVKNLEEEEEGEEGEDVQQLLTRLGNRKHLEDEKIRLLVKG